MKLNILRCIKSPAERFVDDVGDMIYVDGVIERQQTIGVPDRPELRTVSHLD